MDAQKESLLQQKNSLYARVYHSRWTWMCVEGDNWREKESDSPIPTNFSRYSRSSSCSNDLEHEREYEANCQWIQQQQQQLARLNEEKSNLLLQHQQQQQSHQQDRQQWESLTTLLVCLVSGWISLERATNSIGFLSIHQESLSLLWSLHNDSAIYWEEPVCSPRWGSIEAMEAKTGRTTKSIISSRSIRKPHFLKKNRLNWTNSNSVWTKKSVNKSIWLLFSNSNLMRLNSLPFKYSRLFPL